MRTREQMLSEIMFMHLLAVKNQERLKDKMNNLYIEAKQVEDLDDDNRTGSSSYLECIKSYATVNEELYEKLKKELVTKVLNYRHTND